MRIKSIKTSKYKNLRDIQLDFGADLITLLVGQNGLGKSNLIEILTFIFKDLYTITKKKDFIASANKSELNDYTIEYECRGIDVKIDYDDGNQLSIYTKRQSEDYESMSFAEYQRNAKTLLPNRIVGYYSGENKRLERMLDKYTEKDKKRQSNTYKDGNETQKLRSIFFSENKHSQLILFTLAMYWEHPEIGQSVDKILTDLLGINKIIGFDLTFKSPSFFKLKENEKRLEYYEGEILSSNDYSKFDNDHIFWGIKGSVDSLLKVFLFEYLGSSSCTIYEENNKEYFTINENLIGQSSLFEKIYTTFPDPLDFFNALEATSSIGVLEDIKLNISKIGDDDDYNFTALSEGEQQLISVLGLMAILKDDKEEVLYLIDEPDTHINPKWQRNFVQLLLDNIGDNQYRHMFISTHLSLRL